VEHKLIIMSINEIYDCVTSGMNWLTIYGGCTYAGIMLSNFPSLKFSKKIRTQQELDFVVEEESHKLGLKNIRGILANKGKCHGLAYIGEDGTPTIEVGGLYASKSGVRHELYHHYKDHCNPMKENWFPEAKYWFVEEPLACLYQTFRIKI